MRPFERGDIAYNLNQIARQAAWRQSKMLLWGGDYVGPQGAGEFFQKLGAQAQRLIFKLGRRAKPHVVAESSRPQRLAGIRQVEP